MTNKVVDAGQEGTKEWIKKAAEEIEKSNHPNIWSEKAIARYAEVLARHVPVSAPVPERTKPGCKLCVRGDIPEWSPYAKCYIHRSPTLDRRCDNEQHRTVPVMHASDEEAIRLAAVIYCKEHELNYTLGIMDEMAKFAIDCLLTPAYNKFREVV